jgi:FkbM family methyltransferase
MSAGSAIKTLRGLLRTRVAALKRSDRRADDCYGGHIYGHKMFFDPDDAGLHLDRLVGAPLSDAGGEVVFLRENLRPGQVFVDVGANVGFLTLVAARQVGPKGQVFAFEPGPLNFALLSANVAVNHYRNITLENAAVTDRSGTINLHVCATGGSDNRVTGAIAEGSGRECVPVRSVALDDYLQDKAVDLIKIDVQGAEPMVMQGMARLMSESRNLQVMIEYSPQCFAGLETAATFLSRIESWGYETFELQVQGVRCVGRADLLGMPGPGRPSLVNLVLRRPN